ncbi:MAG: diaminopimelate decarboxylase family protein [Candidatus Hodarchaeales archaeon]|jgi:diaminopimelate decarboxylase
MHSIRDDFEEEMYLLLKYQEEILHFNGLNLEELLKKYKTPLFIISQKILEIQFERIYEEFSSLNTRSLKIAFSVKSNNLPKVAQTFMEKGSYFEVTSIGEIKHVIANGGAPNKTIYTNIVKNITTIAYCLEKGVGLFAVDSWSDMKKIESVSNSLQVHANVLLRVNPGTLLDDTIFSCTGDNSKIGIPIPENLKEASQLKLILKYCLDSKWLSFKGLHVHLGSQIINLDQYREGMRKVSLLMYQIEESISEIDILDIGGGFPIYYGEKDIPSIRKFRKVIQEEFKDQLSSIELMLESGRYLTAPACVLAFQVSVIKEIDSSSDIVCVDGSFYNTIPDVIIADWHFPIKKVRNNIKSPIISYRIVGSTNDTLDSYKGQTNGNNLVSLDKLEEKDFIVFLQTGAYSISFNSTYCMEERPLVYFISNDSGE